AAAAHARAARPALPWRHLLPGPARPLGHAGEGGPRDPVRPLRPLPRGPAGRDRRPPLAVAGRRGPLVVPDGRVRAVHRAARRGAGLLRVLGVLDQCVAGTLRTSTSVAGADEARVPACAADAEHALGLWLSFVEAIAPPSTPSVLIAPDGQPWLDLLVGRPLP